MKKYIYLVTIGFLIHFNLMAQASSVTLNVEIAGNLPLLISEKDKYLITDLTLTGNLNGTDIRFIREMAGRNNLGDVTNGRLSTLDIAETNIIDGGDSYYSSYLDYGTSNNDIGLYMFKDCFRLSKITLPNSIVTVRADAFFGCIGLIDVIFGENVVHIEHNAFWGCSRLTSVNIPNSVVSIQTSAFTGCDGITSVFIGDKAVNLSGLNFSYYQNLTKIIVSEKNSNYSSKDGVLFNKDKTTLLHFPIAKNNTSYVIPECVVSIEDNAFYDCIKLKNITIPNSVISVKSGAFFGCTELEFITIGENVTSIGSSAFFDCIELTNIEIPNSVILVEAYAFYNCKKLAHVTIGENVLSIGNSAFWGCDEITTINSKNTVPPILGDHCFIWGANKKTCTIYVPMGSKGAYQTASQWKDFENIIEAGTITAIDAINKDEISIQHISGGIIIEAKQQTFVQIYNLFGKIILKSYIGGRVEIPLRQGIYILKTNSGSKKIAVK